MGKIDYFSLVPDEILALIMSNMPRAVHSVAKKVSRRFLIVGLQTHPKGSNINIAFLGHVDCGKSTVLGHLLCDLGVVRPTLLEKNAREAADMGKGSFKYAWSTDRLREERERGITIRGDITQRIPLAEGITCNFVDLPGHRSFLKNTLRGLSCADVHVLVVAAPMGEFEASVSAGGAVPVHTLLSYATNIHHQMATRRGRAPPLVVAVNKMDSPDIPDQQQRFLEIQEELGKVVGQLHGRTPLSFGPLGAGVIPMVPISGWLGENLTAVHHLCPWYEGPSLVDAMLSGRPWWRPTSLGRCSGPACCRPPRPHDGPAPLPGARPSAPAPSAPLPPLPHALRNMTAKKVITGLVRSGEMHVGQVIRFVGIKKFDITGWLAQRPTLYNYQLTSRQACDQASLTESLYRNYAHRPGTSVSTPRFHMHAKGAAGPRVSHADRYPDRYAIEVRAVVASMELDHKAVKEAYQGDLVGITLARTEYRVAGCVPPRGASHPAPEGSALHRLAFTDWVAAPVPVRHFRSGCVGGTDLDATLGTVMPSNISHSISITPPGHLILHPDDAISTPGFPPAPLYTSFIAEIMVRPSSGGYGGAKPPPSMYTPANVPPHTHTHTYPPASGCKRWVRVGYEPQIFVQGGFASAHVLELLFAKPKAAAGPVAPAPAPAHRGATATATATRPGAPADPIRRAFEEQWLSGAFLELCARSTHEQYDMTQWVPRPDKLKAGERGVVRFKLMDSLPGPVPVLRRLPPIIHLVLTPTPTHPGVTVIAVDSLFLDLYRSYVIRAEAASSLPAGSHRSAVRAPSPVATSSPFGVFVMTDGNNLVGLGKVLAFD
ncbi:putative translation elongation factor 1-alpha [Paratrimastix pyriformis]|uniref:Translation elongation factor 1-alpha n=1 Tax=Paratrimastix pyriformis TaxID=342808 RepID=A0ABQ8UT54_9EUKA|nr:putative translation elongation factor 1-alpha [Paratrimastix pyriformis]